MVIREQLRRWRWAVLAIAVVVLAACGANFLTMPLHESDKAQAARDLVAWIVEGRAVPGFGEEYPDSQWMPKMKRFFVICDFVPPEVSLSDDPRVQRITAQEFKAIFKEHGYDDTDYITIELKSESGSEIIMEFSNVFGFLAGHGYRFEFCRKVWGLRANGKFLWVS